jgi:hypothetical protein
MRFTEAITYGAVRNPCPEETFSELDTQWISRRLWASPLEYKSRWRTGTVGFYVENSYGEQKSRAFVNG